MLRFVVGFAVGWIAKKWLDEEIDKNKGTLQDQIKRKLDTNFSSKREG